MTWTKYKYKYFSVYWSVKFFVKEGNISPDEIIFIYGCHSLRSHRRGYKEGNNQICHEFECFNFLIWIYDFLSIGPSSVLLLASWEMLEATFIPQPEHHLVLVFTAAQPWAGYTHKAKSELSVCGRVQVHFGLQFYHF